MQNDCTFSNCRSYRYTLLHHWDELFERRRALFICLNPSTADENQLDPTLTRIKSFCGRLGANEFLMLNIFAYRATDPNDMMAVEDPVGSENDTQIQAAINEAYALNNGHLDIVGGWGNHGLHMDRQNAILSLLEPFRELPNLNISCLGKNANQTPKHPSTHSTSQQIGRLKSCKHPPKNRHLKCPQTTQRGLPANRHLPIK